MPEYGKKGWAKELRSHKGHYWSNFQGKKDVSEEVGTEDGTEWNGMTVVWAVQVKQNTLRNS